ncbi:15782_t:CDS:2 [Funneliformis caledonium]|uniref:15782_t:CDS:1 n=1 Tax=Funneliformis caledonium TaxID=1117310 RepID=A0A9N9J906_9GLOM|nr:15782_t:CDS:2 [Funneliformis caledonium]
MPKIKELSIFERGKIIGLHKDNHNPRHFQNFKYGLVFPASQSGRPSIFNDFDKWHLIQLLKNDRQQSVDELTEKFNELELKTSSSFTICHNLYELGYHGIRKL